jgi:glutathione S-transferase/alpha,alpha-trehalase
MKSFFIILLGAPFASSFVQVSNLKRQHVMPTTTSLDAMTLFGSQGSRSPLVNWGALEMDLPLTMGNLMMNPHPFKQIPCLTDDEGVMVFESGAILQYVYSKSKSFETDSPERRAAITSWINWANASLDPICFLETPEGKVYDTGMKNPNKRLFTLDSILGKNEYLVEGGFSLADVAVASYLLYVPQFFQGIDLTRYPNIVRYMRKCAERPAYGEAFTPRVQSYLVSTLSAQEGSGAEGEEKKKFFGMF